MSLSHLQWRATEWLLAFGPLTPVNLMDYFVLSPFFDRHSTNAQLRMQMQFSRGGMEGVDEARELERFTGTEYVLAEWKGEGLAVVHKRVRKDAQTVSVIAAYYVLNASIYQAPTMYSVINERLLTSLQALSTSLSLLQARAPTWTPERLQAWDVKPVSTLDPPDPKPIPIDEPPEGTTMNDAENIEEGEELVEEEEGERQDFNPILWRALQSTAQAMEASAPPPPVPPPIPVPDPVGENAQLKEQSMEVEPNVAKGAVKTGSNGSLEGPSAGKRKRA